MPLAFAGPATPLSADDIDAAARDLGCSPAVVRAVCAVEAAGSGFLPDGRPKILFEAHVFGRLTAHIWDHAVPNISAPRWDRSLYGPAGAHQYTRLLKAIAVDRSAALKSASWGSFQILGLNHAVCSFPDVESFVAAMVTGERAHLEAFAEFCRASRLDRFLRADPPDFAAFARGYNGPAYAENAYDVKLAAAWRKWLSAPPNITGNITDAAPASAVGPSYTRIDAARDMQAALARAGFDPGPIDGAWGRRSREAYERFNRG